MRRSRSLSWSDSTTADLGGKPQIIIGADKISGHCLYEAGEFMTDHRRTPTLIKVVLLSATFILGRLLLDTHAQSTSQAGTGVIQGIVVRAGTGQPLKRARVSLRRVNGSQTLPNLTPAAAAVMQ